MEARSSAKPASPPARSAEKRREPSDLSITSFMEETLNTGSPGGYCGGQLLNVRICGSYPNADTRSIGGFRPARREVVQKSASGDRLCSPLKAQVGHSHRCSGYPSSISQPLIHNVLQRLALLKPTILLQKEAHRLILPVGRVIRAVRRQQNIIELVQQMSRRQRFVLKHI
jgi:hypothetical protein